MPDTPRTLAALQALLADNATADISAQDVRDFLVSVFPQTTKGDLPGIDATGIIGRLPATTDGFVLTLDAAEAFGFKWAAAGAGAHPDLATHDALGLATDAVFEEMDNDIAALKLPDYLVGTATATLSGEIVVGTSPGGELGGTWASPTVDATHSGSAHHNEAHGIAAHTAHANWKALYTDGSGDEQELSLGAANTVYRSAGASSAPTFDYVYHELTLTIENPSASDNVIMRQFTQAVTITAIQAAVLGGTSVTIDPEHGSTTTTATKLLSAAESVASASTTGEHIGGTGTAMAASFNDATLAAGDFLRLKTTAISGSPTQLSVTIKWRLT